MTAEKDSSVKSESDSVGTKKLSPMAFTVDFGGADTKKCFGIADSISKFAPRHRKNLSLTKIEDIIIGREKAATQKKDDSSSATALLSKLSRKVLSGASSNSSKDKDCPQSDTENLSRVIKDKGGTKEKVPFRKTLSDKKSMLSKPKASVLPTPSGGSVSLASMKDACNNNLDQFIKRDGVLGDSKASSSQVSPDTEDVKSETGTYTIDDSPEEVNEAREKIDSVFGTNTKDSGGDNERAGTPELEWVREWAESAAQLQQSPTRGKQ